MVGDKMNTKVDNKLIVSSLIIFLLIIVGVKQYNIPDRFKKEEPETKKIKKVVDTVSVKLIINDKELNATLIENETTKELLERLPLEIEMNELNGNEKYYYFEDKLKSNPFDVEKIKKGDIMLFSDNCLVLFYKDFNTKYAYTKLGTLDNPEELDLDDSNITVKIEK